MRKLRKDAERAPVSNIVIILLLVVGFASFPIKDTIGFFGLEYTGANRYLFTAAFRLLFLAVMVYFLFTYRFQKSLNFRFRRFYEVIPCYLVVINNFPIVALATGQAQVNASAGMWALYLLQTLCITAFEEVAFRGIIFPLCYLKLKKHKRAVFWAVALSSALFGAVHLVNLLGGAGLAPTLLQVGYSFLIGAMCAVAMLLSESLFVPISLHFIFNAGGLLVEELGSGNILNLPTVILTVVIGVAVGTYLFYVAFGAKNDSMEKLIAYGEEAVSENAEANETAAQNEGKTEDGLQRAQKSGAKKPAKDDSSDGNGE